MPRLARVLVLVLLAVLLAPAARADVLHLKDGRRIEGTVTLDTAEKVQIETRLGRLEFPRAEVERIEHGKSKAQEFDERWRAAVSADDFHALGTWAEEQRMQAETRRCMRKAVELDPQHPAANRWLGNVEHRGEWITPEERDRRMQAEHEAEMRARGLVLHEGRWVTPEEKQKLEQGLVLHEGRWISLAAAQRAKGLEEYEGDWIPRHEALALLDVAAAAAVAQQPFQRALNAQAILAGPVDQATLDEVARGILVGREWFDHGFEVEPGLGLFGGRLAEFYLFSRSSEPYLGTVAHFASLTDTLPEGWAEAARKVHGFVYWDPIPVSSARRWHRDERDLIGHCYHHWGHLLLNRLGYDGKLLPPWYDESFASLMEFQIHRRNAVFCRTQLAVGSGTSARRGETFQFDPKDMREGRWREVLKAALEQNQVPSFDRLAQKQFGELSLIDVATGMAIIEWIAASGEKALPAWQAELRRSAPALPNRVIANVHERMAAHDRAFEAACGKGMVWRRADREWRGWFLAR